MTQLNPAVQKLAEQAKGFVDLNQHVGSDNGCMIYTYEGLNKFAELIVRECLKCGDNLSKYYIENHPEKEQVLLLASIADYSNQIKQHFGVER
jgi:hypothetical protein